MSCVFECRSEQGREESLRAKLEVGKLTLLISEFQTLRSLDRVGSLSEAEMFPASVEAARRLVDCGLAVQRGERYSVTDTGRQVAAAMPFAWTDEIVVVDLHVVEPGSP